MIALYFISRKCYWPTTLIINLLFHSNRRAIPHKFNDEHRRFEPPLYRDVLLSALLVLGFVSLPS